MDELTDEDILDMIRNGETLKEFEKYEHLLKTAGNFSENVINRIKKMFRDYESGKLKVTCTEEDKKRIIMEHIKAYKKAGDSDKEIEKDLEEDINFIK